ncbi:hypothetical protein H0E87_022554 [Populus deltoides]|uniref:Uncharacterized protein n=1 Tax=Populus deltoides TaxID=3696 RepID=A0A8T2XCF7_POPDE|nr:hypothetical protein H0E87_022554 [Populus deltoides]
MASVAVNLIPTVSRVGWLRDSPSAAEERCGFIAGSITALREGYSGGGGYGRVARLVPRLFFVRPAMVQRGGLASLRDFSREAGPRFRVASLLLSGEGLVWLRF